jgi:lipopolysaccharide export system permease protein
MRPLSILDRYLIKKFIGILVFALIAMITIFVAVNYVENTDRFIDRKVPADVIIQYYIHFIPHIITLTLPVDVLLACLFSLGSLARFNELTAIKASGVSLFRIILPLFILGAGISLFDFWLSENVVPDSNRRKSEIWKTYVDRSASNRKLSGEEINLYDPSGIKVIMDRFDKKTLTISNLSIQEFYQNHIVYRIDAEEANWDSAQAFWILRNGAQRKFQDQRETVSRFAILEKPGLFFTPDDILKGERNPDEMDFRELFSFIEKLRKSGSRTERWEVDYHLKYAYPLTCLIMILFGAPLAATRKKSGAGLNIFLTLVICFSYWIIIQMGRYLGYNQTIEPVNAAWIGNAIFGFFGIIIYLRMKS